MNSIIMAVTVTMSQMLIGCRVTACGQPAL